MKTCLKYFLYLCVVINFIAGNSNEAFLQPEAHESFLCDKVNNHEPRAFIFKGMGKRYICVEINGVFYESIKCATKALNISYEIIKVRCLFNDYPNYKIVPFRVTYTEKRCTTCKEKKLLKMFYNCATSRDGFRSECKVCGARRTREHRAKTYVKKGQVNAFGLRNWF